MSRRDDRLWFEENRKNPKPQPSRQSSVEDIGAEARSLGIYDLEIIKGAIVVFMAAGWEPAQRALKKAKEMGLDMPEPKEEKTE